MFQGKIKIIILIALLLTILLLLVSTLVYKKPQVIQPLPVIRQEESPAPTPVVIKQPVPSGFSNPSIDYIKQHADYIKQTPVLQKLWIHSSLYGIEYIDEQHLIVYSKIPDKEQAYAAAKKWFADNSIDISKILIEYQ